MMSEAFKCCNVLIDVAFFHMELFEVVSSMLVLSIVNKHIVEILFKNLLGCHAEWDGHFSILDFVKPLI